MQAKDNRAIESLRREQKKQRKESREIPGDLALNDALKATFPASDPVADQSPTISGAKTRK